MNRLSRRVATYVILILIISGVCIFNRFEKHRDENVDIGGHLSRDYVLSEYTGTEINVRSLNRISVSQNKVNIYRQTSGVHADHNVKKAVLRTLKGEIPIFVHSKEVDNMISSYVKDYGTWEEDLLQQTGEYLQRFKDMVFIDIGCNIGVYALSAAKLGKKVIAVDPIEINLKLLEQSLHAGNLLENVTLILNAVSDKYKTVTVDIPTDNIGGAHIVDDSAYNPTSIIKHAETILLDDIIPYVTGDKVFIKMDVEGHEWNVIKGGVNLIESKHVKAILMEWVHHRHQKNGQLIVEHLVKHGFLPYNDLSMTSILEPDEYYMWPENVFWVKR